MLVSSFYLWTLCTLFLMAVDAQPCEDENITSWTGDIYSPDYPAYRSNLDCYWLLQVAEGNLIEINFQDFSMTSFADDSAEKNGNCPNDYVEILDGSYGSTSRIAKLCGYSLPVDERVFRSNSNFLLLHMHTDNEISNRGFVARHSGVCQVNLTAVSGTIMSPNHPNDYPSSIQCLWLIDLGLGYNITLTFHEFELEKKEDCSYDWVSVREGNTDTSPEIIHVCGDLLPPTITSEGPMRIYFKTDTDNEFSGFHMTYEAQDVDDCVNNACANGASCMDAINSYWCNCAEGFTGAYCETGMLPSTRGDLNSIAVSSREKKSLFATTSPNMLITPSSSVLGFVSTRTTPLTRSPEIGMLPSTRGLLNSIAVSSLEKKSLFATTFPNMPITPSSSALGFVSTQTTPVMRSLEIEYTFSIKILDDWTYDLQDKDSDAFQELSFQLETEIKKKLSGTRDFIGVKVLSFRKGSIVAEFQLIFSTNVQPKEAFDMMKEMINDGNLGRIRIDPASLKLISLEPKGPEDLPYAIIMGASFGGLFVLILGGILLYRFYMNKKAADHRKRNRSDMPPDEAFPNSEKYEMKSTENIVYAGSLG